MRTAGFFILILLYLMVSFEGICLADGSDASLLYFQGKEGRITNETGGIFTITISGLLPNMSVIYGDQNNTAPICLISNISVPLQGAMAFSQTKNPSIAFVNISRISLNGTDKNLTLTVTPLPFSDSTALESVTGDTVDLSQIKAEQWNDIGVYLEIQKNPPTNAYSPEKNCNICREGCLFDPNIDDCLMYCCITHCYCE